VRREKDDPLSLLPSYSIVIQSVDRIIADLLFDLLGANPWQVAQLDKVVRQSTVTGPKNPSSPSLVLFRKSHVQVNMSNSAVPAINSINEKGATFAYPKGKRSWQSSYESYKSADG